MCKNGYPERGRIKRNKKLKYHYTDSFIYTIPVYYKKDIPMNYKYVLKCEYSIVK